MSDKHVTMPMIDDEETLILEEESRLRILTEDFGKHFTPQQELSAEQAFWLQMSDPTSKPSDALPVKIKAPKKLPKISLVNESLKKLKFHLAKFDSVVKIRTTPNALIEGEWGFKHMKAVFNNEFILFLKSLKDICNVFDRDLLNEIMEVQTVFDQMDAVVQQSSVYKQCLEIAKQELILENDRLLQQIMSQDVLLSVMNSMSLIGDTVFKKQFDSIKKARVHTKEQSDSLIDKLILKSTENEALKAQIQEKVFVITSLKNNLQRIKGKEIIDITAQKPSATTIVPRMFKLDLEPLAPRLLQNKEIHLEYHKNTQEQAYILQGIIEQAKPKQPLDNALDFACKHAQRIQELLVYVQDTCPNTINYSVKKVYITPKNKVKKVRFAKPFTSSSNIKQVELSITFDYNTPVLSPTGLKCSTSNYGSKPTGNKRMIDSRCSKHMTRNRSQLMNFVSKFLGIIRFRNDHITRIIGYGDYQLRNVTISRAYYVEGIGHNLFFVGQFCDADLEVAFRKNTYFIRNLDGVDLIFGSCDINLYTISLDDMLKTSPMCLLSKVSKTKSWLWHRWLSHLNFGTLNKLAKNSLARVHNVRTDNRTKFVNQTLREFYENVGISHQTSIACTPQQNGIVER
nr:integrase, catalytic region, zinc finger, CCHC-type, peptidase aspartic, catalytic [Tanacetum cinerariifolium]